MPAYFINHTKEDPSPIRYPHTGKRPSPSSKHSNILKNVRMLYLTSKLIKIDFYFANMKNETTPETNAAHEIERTTEFERALELMRTGGAFTFITGRAGTGKSTLLQHFSSTTDLFAPTLAPTGVAALNVGGETIHRFFRFAPGICVKDARKKGAACLEPDVYRKADMLIIDEISMVRADLLDCMDQFLRIVRNNNSTFGGLRIVAIGDLYQLPPVVSSGERKAFSELYDSPYFFSSRAMKELLAAEKVAFIELEKVYRQTDKSFISLLNAVRNRSITNDELQQLNSRVSAETSNDAIVLTAMNAVADDLNEQRLRKLKGRSRNFEGSFRGNFPEKEAPTDPSLSLKIGARVMCVANNPSNAFVNGSLGVVRAFVDDGDETSVIVGLDNGKSVNVSPHTWSVYRSVYDKKARSLGQEKLGSFTQIPLRLAWAVTIHKSQGKTFDKTTIDLGRGAFATGQTYVALSRCRSFDGLSLVKPIAMNDIRMDYSIVKFQTSLQYALAHQATSMENIIYTLKNAAKNRQRLTITYLKGKDEKSRRTIIPRVIEDDEYNGNAFLALRAWCELRQDERTFNVARILDIHDAEPKQNAQ
jgi:energy-coupling factor transporter ATP-binding protein EcfA2